MVIAGPGEPAASGSASSTTAMSTSFAAPAIGRGSASPASTGSDAPARIAVAPVAGSGTASLHEPDAGAGSRSSTVSRGTGAVRAAAA